MVIAEVRLTIMIRPTRARPVVTWAPVGEMSVRAATGRAGQVRAPGIPGQ